MVRGEVKPMVKKQFVIAVPENVAEAFGLVDGKLVDVDYFESIEALHNHYDSDLKVIAITHK
jgi:hypothetical protein